MNQMFPAVGMVEFSSLGAGIEASDAMVKAASVSPLFFKTICPGKFLAAVGGDVAAVAASVAAGRERAADVVVDWLVIPNIHPGVLTALTGADLTDRRGALGIIETFSVAAIIRAADAAIKAAEVRLTDVRIAMGLGGKGYALMVGDVGAVRAAVAAGAAGAAESGLLVRQVVIPKPHADVYAHVL